ncbi:MAG: hypothetical protein Kow0059_09600 [Candidatus Sumerlaeia bacterium]
MAELCTAFELNETECKIVALRQHKQQITLMAAAMISFIEEQSGETINDRRKSQLIRDTLKQKKIPVHNATLVLPKHSVQVRCVTLPSDKDDELARMARFEAAKIIPFNVENHIISHHVLKKDSIRGSRVLLAAVEDKNAEDSIQVLRQAGVETEFITVSNIALYNIFHILEPRHSGEETYTLLNIGYHAVDISIIDKGLLVFSRSSLSGLDRLAGEVAPGGDVRRRLSLEQIRRLAAPVPAERPAGGLEGGGFSSAPAAGPMPLPNAAYQPFSVPAKAAAAESPDAAGAAVQAESTVPPESRTAAPEALDLWLSKVQQEIRRTYEFSRREFDIPAVARLYVTGEGALIQGLDDYFSASLGVDTLILNPLQSDMIKDSGEVLASPLDCFNYAIATGGAIGTLWEDACRINLIPARYIEQRQARRKRQNLIVTGALAAMALVLGLLSANQYHEINKSRLRWYSSELNEINPIYQEIQDIAKKKKILDSHIRDRRSALAILEKISQLEYIPQKVAILEFKYIKGETLVIQAHALAIEDINRFIYDLEHMETDDGQKFFTAVRERQRRPTKLPRRNEQIYQFNLECEIAKGKTSPTRTEAK